MSVIIVALTVEGTNADPPAAVAVPAHGLHRAALHRHNGGAQTAHQVVAQVLSAKSKGTGHAEIIAVAVAIACRNGRKGFQTVGGQPLPVLFDGVAAH